MRIYYAAGHTPRYGEKEQNHRTRDTSTDVELYYDGFGDSSINFVVRFWIDYRNHSDYLGARSDAIKRIKKAFDENGITIPFPIRTLDFGVVGGVNLDEVPAKGNGGL
ncbi:MAG: mechanosensitive ion channel family protein [Rhodothermales bacterium]